MATPSSALPPPPDPGQQVPQVPSTTSEKVAGAVGSVMSKGIGPTIYDAVQRHYNSRLAEAKMAHDEIARSGAVLSTGMSPDNNDPTTGQPLPLSDQERQDWNDRHQKSMDAFKKIMGVTPEIKQDLEQKTSLLQQHLQAQEAQQKGQSQPAAAAGASPQGAPAQGAAGASPTASSAPAAAPAAPSSTLSGPPPVAASQDAGTAPVAANPGAISPPPSASPDTSAAPAASVAPTGAMTPPPDAPQSLMESEAQGPRVDRQMAAQQSLRYAAQQTAAKRSAEEQELPIEAAKSDIETKRLVAVEHAKPGAAFATALQAMDPKDAEDFLNDSAPPNMTPDEQAEFDTAKKAVKTSGKMAALTSAVGKIYAERQTAGRAAQNLATRVSEFQTTDAYRKWATNLNNDTKNRIANLTQDKAPATMMQTAQFAQGGLTSLDDASQLMDRLEQSGVLGSLPANKVEDWIFGKGLVDPTLDPQTRRDIGQLRSAMDLAGSAMLRAHTGRTSKEIYDDFKGMLGVGQDWSALRGAMDESRKLLGEYAGAASDVNIKNIRSGGTSSPPPPPTKGAPRIIKYDAQGNRVQ